jgi:hypothetical protein
VIVLCSFVTVGVLGIAVGARSAPTDPIRTVLVDASRAEGAVGRLLSPAELQGLSVSPPVAGAVDTYYEVTSKSARATVDVNDGHVTMLIRQTKLPGARDTTVSAVDAEAGAIGWLKAHDIPIDGMTAKTDLIDHGDTTAYTVSLTHVVDRVIVPDTRTLYVNPASGEIFMLADYRHPFSPPPTAKVSVDQANASAASTVGGKHVVVDHAQLMIIFAPDGGQRLVWQVAVSAELDDSPADDPVVAHYLVEVDALYETARVVAQG